MFCPVLLVFQCIHLLVTASYQDLIVANQFGRQWTVYRNSIATTRKCRSSALDLATVARTGVPPTTQGTAQHPGQRPGEESSEEPQAIGGNNSEAAPGGAARIEDDYLTVTLLSAGLAGMLTRRRLAAAGQHAGPGDGLLPPAWRLGFSRLWWRCQAQDVRPFESDLDLLAECAHPLVAWRVSLSLSDEDLQSCLLVDGELSGLAEQGARLAGADVEAEWIENRVYEALRRVAEVNGGDDDREVERIYAVLRRRIIDHPVLTDRDLSRWEREFRSVDSSGQTYVRRLVEVAYVPRPAQGKQQYFRCAGCKNTVPGAGAVCGTAGCTAGMAEQVTANPLAVLYEQHRATRRFVHDPGLVENRIFDALASDAKLDGKVRLTAYPRLDALDLLIEFLGTGDDGRPRVVRTWGVDAKDQVSARLLGRSFTWPGSVRCDRRFLALPMHRARHPGYTGDLTAELEGRVEGVEVVDEERLTAMVKATAREVAR